jgi:hypothetical protein
MEQNCNWENPRARTIDDKSDAAKVILTFSAPLPEKVTGVPSQRYCARVLCMPQKSLAPREKALIDL